jgi:hypothetical protein
MFGFRISVKSAVTLLTLAALTGGATTLQAQTTRRTRRESNANRKARIERTIQETYSHKYEVAGGGGYLRFRSGETLQKNNEVTFWTNFTRYLNPKLGIVGDIRGAYGNAVIGNTPFNIANPQISQYNFMGGANYRFYNKEKYSISVYGVGGGAYGKFDSGSKGIPSQFIHVWESGFRPALSAGVNFDYNFYPNIAVRVSPTYVGSFYRLSPFDTVTPKGSIQNNFGFNIGVVYRFGRNK